jgi:putative ABC transport system permease protein
VAWWRRLRTRGDLDRQLDAELRDHMERLTADFIAAGAPEHEARRRARLEFGGLDQVKEVCREVRGLNLVDDLFQDFRYSLRSLRKSPGFASVVILTLALGIGANAAIFSVVNAVLVRPLPFSDPDELVRIYRSSARMPDRVGGLSPDLFEVVREQNQSFEAVAGYHPMADGFSFASGDRAIQVYGARVTANFFRVFGVRPHIGATFQAGDDSPGATPKAVIAFAFWQNDLHGDPQVVGRLVRLDGRDVTVIGVMPPGFWFPRGDLASVWVCSPGQWAYQIIGRLRPGMTATHAQADLDRIASHVQQRFSIGSEPWVITTRSLKEAIVGNTGSVLWLLLAAVVLVLVIACVNVANLLLARATVRDRELAIRVSLGAGRGRIVRQLLAESVVLAGAGAVGGVLLARWGIAALVALIPRDLQLLRDAEVTADTRVLVVTGMVALASAMLFGGLPALFVSARRLSRITNEGGRSPMTPTRRRVRALLVVSEFALSVVLLVGAGLVTRSLIQLRGVDSGVRPEHVLTATIALPPLRYDDSLKTTAWYERLLAGLRALPAVESATISFGLPPDRVLNSTTFYVSDQSMPAGQPRPAAEVVIVDGSYFHTLGIPVLRGRVFDARDTASSSPAIIINQTLARQFFGDLDPIGRTLIIFDNQPHTVVGVVKDVKYAGLAAAAELTLYQPFAQNPFAYMSMAVRTSGDSKTLAAAIGGQVANLDRDAALGRVRMMDELLAESVGGPRFRTMLLLTFAGVALVLAAVGIYGVLVYSVSQRTHEMGVRLALGAQAGDVAKVVIGEGLALALAGIGIGLGAALALTRVMTSLLFGVTTTDPTTFGVVSVLLTTVALLACWIPARRAMRVDPLISLRAE